jgi:hypothetical protein
LHGKRGAGSHNPKILILRTQRVNAQGRQQNYSRSQLLPPYSIGCDAFSSNVFHSSRLLPVPAHKRRREFENQMQNAA